MYGETLHQYLLYNAEDYKRPGGQMFHTYPSLKYPEDQKRLWEATNRGAIQVIATDELCCPLRVKLQGSRIDDTTGGNSGVEPRVGLMYTQMVTKRGYSPAHFVDMISSNAARIMGLYPRKGALAVGSDADIVLLQTGIEKTIRAADLHETDYTPWEGPRGDGVAGHDHPARQRRRGERRLPRRPQARAVSQAQGGGGDPQPAGRLGKWPSNRASLLPLAGVRKGEVPSSYEGDGVMGRGLRLPTPPSPKGLEYKPEIRRHLPFANPRRGGERDFRLLGLRSTP